MKKIANKSIPLFQLEESHLESKYRSEGFTYMIVNGYEVRWPRWENFVAALEDRTAEFFSPVGHGRHWAMKDQTTKTPPDDGRWYRPKPFSWHHEDGRGNQHRKPRKGRFT